MEINLILILSGLQFKHLVADFVWQPIWMVRNKGTYGHIAGVVHAGLHAFFTGLILLLFSVGFYLIVSLVVAEFIVHYHIDWSKERLNYRLNYGPSDQRFWVLMGIDQFAHQLTYLAIIFALIWY